MEPAALISHLTSFSSLKFKYIVINKSLGIRHSGLVLPQKSIVIITLCCSQRK